MASGCREEVLAMSLRVPAAPKKDKRGKNAQNNPQCVRHNVNFVRGDGNCTMYMTDNFYNDMVGKTVYDAAKHSMDRFDRYVKEKEEFERQRLLWTTQRFPRHSKGLRRRIEQEAKEDKLLQTRQLQQVQNLADLEGTDTDGKLKLTLTSLADVLSPRRAAAFQKKFQNVDSPRAPPWEPPNRPGAQGPFSNVPPRSQYSRFPEELYQNGHKPSSMTLRDWRPGTGQGGMNG